MAMSYEDQVRVGNIFNVAIVEVLGQTGLTDEHPEIISAIAQSILVKLDQAGFKIEHK